MVGGWWGLLVGGKDAYIGFESGRLGRLLG